MYKDHSDQILLSLISKRDKVAFQELYDRYWDRVLVVCINRVGNSVVAEDLVQDIFVSIWEHKNLVQIANIEAYLFQAVKFSVIKSFHKSSKISLVDDQTIGLLDSVSDLSLEDALNYKLIKDLIFQEVENLPERTRTIFLYSRVDQMSSTEIGEKLNISSRTVENQISKALKSLRKFLRNIDFFVFFKKWRA